MEFVGVVVKRPAGAGGTGWGIGRNLHEQMEFVVELVKRFSGAGGTGQTFRKKEWD